VKLALIPPIPLLEDTATLQYQLMLPQLCNDAYYLATYERYAKSLDKFVILDNGAAEGQQVRNDELFDLSRMIRPDELVIPDTIGDARQTMEEAEDFLMHWASPDQRLMFVAQGQMMDDFIHSAAWAHDRDEIETIAIPRHAIKTLGDPWARATIVKTLYASYGAHLKDIHFLGASTHYPIELRDLAPSVRSLVRSVDTSMPYTAAWYGMPLDGSSGLLRPDNYFNRRFIDFSQAEMIGRNVRELEEWVEE